MSGRLFCVHTPMHAGDILTLIRPKLSWGEAAAAQSDNRVRFCWAIASPIASRRSVPGQTVSQATLLRAPCILGTHAPPCIPRWDVQSSPIQPQFHPPPACLQVVAAVPGLVTVRSFPFHVLHAPVGDLQLSEKSACELLGSLPFDNVLLAHDFSKAKVWTAESAKAWAAAAPECQQYRTA